ncbi:MAG: alpha-amylase family glycosyl hydrolase [Muribaculaceae bacterium]
MRKLQSFLLLVCMLCTSALYAEVVTTVPAILQEGSPNVVVTFYAKEGNAGLAGVAGIYAHTGVITNKSTSDADWKYAPTWLDNDTKYKLKLAGTNKWKLTIGDIRAYYGITDPTEVVTKLAFVFRNADGTKEGKAADGGDIFIEVHADGLALNLTSDAGGSIITDNNSTVRFTASSTVACNLKMYINSTESAPIAQVDNATSLVSSYTFPKGDYDVIAVAKNGAETVTKSVSLCHRGESQSVAFSGTLLNGTTVNPDETVTFCLYAPNKTNVMLMGEWNNYKPMNANLMNYQGDKYFWVTVPGLDMNKEYGYYFLVDDNLNIADPYSKLILDPWSDKYINQNSVIYPNLKPFPVNLGNFIISVFQGNETKYDWQVADFKAPSKDQLMIYELLFRDFTDTRSVNAAIDKLDYLQGLGINAIELMPIQEFDGNESWGYNPNFYFAPDKAYGTKNDYKRFVDECHKRGIAVILDVVFNQSWGQHPWCKMYWDAANNCPAVDSPFQNAVAPHDFSVGNDWKQENVEVQNHFCDVLKYWLKEYKVDGYRFDLVKGLGASNSYGSAKDGNKYNQSRVDIINKYIAAMRSVNPNAYPILEAFVDRSEENNYGNNGAMCWREMNDNYCETAMGNKRSFLGMCPGDEGRPFGSTVGYMESHDKERAAFKQKEFGNAGIKGNVEMSMRRLGANAAMTVLVPGPKMIWQFGEFGYDVSIDEGGRTSNKPTHWEYLDNEFKKGLHNSYAELLNIRKSNPDLFSQAAEFYWGASDWDNGRFITTRNNTTGKQLIVAYNPFTADRTFNYSFTNVGGTYYINSKTYNTNPSFNSSVGTITVPANGYVVISNMKDASGVEDVITDGVGEKVSIYPNPTTDTFTVNSDNVESVNVYSMTGALVVSVEGTNSIDVSNLATGNYIVKVVTATAATTHKLIKR